MGVIYADGAVYLRIHQVEPPKMPDLQPRTIKIPEGKGELLAKVFSGIGDRIRIDKTLLVIRGESVHFFELGIGKAHAKAMPQRFVGIGLIIIQFKLPGIPGDQPGSQVIITAGEIIMGEFGSIVYPVQFVPFLRPRGYVAVGRLEIRKRKDIPALFYIDLNVGYISSETFQINDNLVE